MYKLCLYSNSWSKTFTCIFVGFVTISMFLLIVMLLVLHVVALHHVEVLVAHHHLLLLLCQWLDCLVVGHAIPQLVLAVVLHSHFHHCHHHYNCHWCHHHVHLHCCSDFLLHTEVDDDEYVLVNW